MITAFEFIIEYFKKSARQRVLLSRSLRYLYNLSIGSIQRVQIYGIKGLVENSDNRVTTVFVGTENGAHQFASLVYGESYETQPIGELRFNQIAPALSANTSEIMAIRVEKPAANEFEKLGYLLLPNVSFKLDLHRPLDEIIKRMSRRRRRDIKKIEALDYSYKICQEDDEAFNFFYWKMYMPYAAQRFGEAAYIKSYNESMAFYRTGGRIVFVKKSEKLIAGTLFQIIGKTLYAISMGSYQQGETDTKQLASQAALLFLVKWAKMNGLENLDYGTSLPFFRGGIFNYKKEWGMSLEEPIDESYCALRLNSLNAGTLSFLEQNPFIISHEGTLKGVVLLNHKPTSEELQKIFSEYFIPRLSSIIFIAYYKINMELSDKAELSAKPTDFPRAFSKSLLDICLFLQENAFKVEVLELTGSNEKQRKREILQLNVHEHLETSERGSTPVKWTD